MHAWIAGFLWLTAAVWLGIALHQVRSLRGVRVLPAAEASGDAPASAPPSVSVVVAARDEEARIETTVRRLLGQRGVRLELIVVDDRSDDATARILERLAREDARLRVVRVDTLPPEWIGKCHALHVGGNAAGGEWILFTDADVWLAPDVLARAVRAARADRAEHLSLLPSQRLRTATAKAANLAFSFLLLGNAAAVNRDRRRAFLGIGAFNLLRAETWRAIGGHEPLRLEVCDDMKLGLLVSRAGKRTRAYFGGHDLEVQWATSAWGLLRALEKNVFAMLRFSTAFTAAVVLIHLSLWSAALIGPATGTPAGLAAGAGLASLVVPARMLCVRAGWGWAPALLTPLMFACLPLAIARSAAITLRRGGVSWRGTFYPLEVLRRGLVR